MPHVTDALLAAVDLVHAAKADPGATGFACRLMVARNRASSLPRVPRAASALTDHAITVVWTQALCRRFEEDRLRGQRAGAGAAGSLIVAARAGDQPGNKNPWVARLLRHPSWRASLLQAAGLPPKNLFLDAVRSGCLREALHQLPALPAPGEGEGQHHRDRAENPWSGQLAAAVEDMAAVARTSRTPLPVQAALQLASSRAADAVQAHPVLAAGALAASAAELPASLLAAAMHAGLASRLLSVSFRPMGAQRALRVADEASVVAVLRGAGSLKPLVSASDVGPPGAQAGAAQAQIDAGWPASETAGRAGAQPARGSLARGQAASAASAGARQSHFYGGVAQRGAVRH